MSTPFDAVWTDEQNVRITVTSQQSILTIKYGNGRGPFTGVSLTVGTPVIYGNFTDDGQFTGVLDTSQSKICWSNGTVWHK